MPVFDKDNLMDIYNAKGISFSAVRPEKLSETEYTLVTIVCDKSGSVHGFEGVLEKTVQDAVSSCGKSNRAQNLLVRVISFNTNIIEVHGFRNLSSIDSGDYTKGRCEGETALNDATINALRSTKEYARELYDKDFSVNSIIFVVTDGEENCSRVKQTEVLSETEDIRRSEIVESHLTILVGVNTGVCAKSLEKWQKEVGVDEYIDIQDFDPRKGARLAQFISKSISSQSQSLGTGGPSQVLDF